MNPRPHKNELIRTICSNHQFLHMKERERTINSCIREREREDHVIAAKRGKGKGRKRTHVANVFGDGGL